MEKHVQKRELKPYAPPKAMEYGEVTRLTLGSS